MSRISIIHRLSRSILVASLALLSGSALAGAPDALVSSKSPNQGRTSQQAFDWPLLFVPNQGQWASDLAFLVQTAESNIFFAKDHMALVVPGDDSRSSVVRMRPLGAAPDPQILPGQPLKTRFSYLHGQDRDQWRSGVPSYDSIRYQGLYPGVDLVFRRDGQDLAYDFVLAPGATPEPIQVALEGVETLALAEDGAMIMTLPNGSRMQQKAPVVYQEVDGERRVVEGRFRIRSSGDEPGRAVFGFEVAGYDASKPLVIDPTLEYSTFVGGNKDDDARAMVVTSKDEVIIAGSTTSSEFPEALVVPTKRDGVVYQVADDGSALDYVVVLGGSGDDQINGMTLDAAEDYLYLTGFTKSTDFPMWNAMYPVLPGGKAQAAFIVRLDTSDPTVPDFATYFGGLGTDAGHTITLEYDADGDPQYLYVAGETGSDDLVVRNAPYAYYAGGVDGFLAKFSLDGEVLYYASYFGGTGKDIIKFMTVNPDGIVSLAGETTSKDLPTKNAIQSMGGGTDLFLARISRSGRELVSSTYLGGKGNDNLTGMIPDDDWNLFLSGYTTSTDFPIRNALYGKYLGGKADGFVVKVDYSLSFLHFSTYLGGIDDDAVLAITLDQEFDEDLSDTTDSGSEVKYIYVAGKTNSNNFPTENAYRTYYSGGVDGFVAKLDPRGLNLINSSYFGGLEDESITLIGAGSELSGVFIAGNTESTSVDQFPLSETPFSRVHGGGIDQFVAKLSEVTTDPQIPMLALGFESVMPEKDWLADDSQNPSVSVTLKLDENEAESGIVAFSTVLNYDTNELVYKEAKWTFGSDSWTENDTGGLWIKDGSGWTWIDADMGGEFTTNDNGTTWAWADPMGDVWKWGGPGNIWKWTENISSDKYESTDLGETWFWTRSGGDEYESTDSGATWTNSDPVKGDEFTWDSTTQIWTWTDSDADSGYDEEFTTEDSGTTWIWTDSGEDFSTTNDGVTWTWTDSATSEVWTYTTSSGAWSTCASCTSTPPSFTPLTWTWADSGYDEDLTTIDNGALWTWTDSGEDFKTTNGTTWTWTDSATSEVWTYTTSSGSWSCAPVTCTSTQPSFTPPTWTRTVSGEDFTTINGTTWTWTDSGEDFSTTNYGASWTWTDSVTSEVWTYTTSWVCASCTSSPPASTPPSVTLSGAFPFTPPSVGLSKFTPPYFVPPSVTPPSSGVPSSPDYLITQIDSSVNGQLFIKAYQTSGATSLDGISVELTFEISEFDAEFTASTALTSDPFDSSQILLTLDQPWASDVNGMDALVQVISGGLFIDRRRNAVLGDCDNSGQVQLWELQKSVEYIGEEKPLCVISNYGVMSTVDFTKIIKNYFTEAGAGIRGAMTSSAPSLSQANSVKAASNTGGSLVLGTARTVGDRIETDLVLTTGAQDVSALFTNITYDPSVFSVVTAIAGPAAVQSGKTVDYKLIEPGLVRVLVYSFSNSIIADGVLATIQLTPNAGYGLANTNLNQVPDASTPDSESVNLHGSSLTAGRPTPLRDDAWRVTEIYIATLGYAPDDEGLQYWIDQLANDPAWTPTTVAQSFFDQPLVQTAYPESLGYEGLIEALYTNLFGRGADADGKAYWLGELQSGRVKRNEMIIALIEGGWANPEAKTDMMRFANRIEVGLAFAAYQADHGIRYSTLSVAEQETLRRIGRELLDKVTDATSTRDTAIDSIAGRLAALL